MRQAPIYQTVDRTRFYSSKFQQTDQLGPAIQRAGTFLAVVCLFFGTMIAALVPASLEQRIESFFFFGLIPAVGFYAGGHILSLLLVFSGELFGMIAARCVRCLALFVNDLVSWVGPKALAKLSQLRQKAYRSVDRRYWRVHAAIFELSCLLIRSAARFVIKMQTSQHLSSWGLRPLIIMGMLLTALGLGWFGASNSYWLSGFRPDEPTGGAVINADFGRDELTGVATIDAVVERIIGVESDGDPNAKNKRSSATGLGQFLNETWLDLIRTHRPDLANGRSESETLELRRDPKVAREITTRFTERNAEMLRKRGLPITPGTLYLAHFAGSAGAVAILSALENADAAFVMASADATGRTKRDKIIKANPFLERFTIADLKSWADFKMRVPGS
jgi:hypothetical protein